MGPELRLGHLVRLRKGHPCGGFEWEIVRLGADLDEPWELVLEEHAVVVRAPAIRYNTPAIDVSNIRYDVADRSFLRDEEVAVENLRKGLSQLSKQRAAENVSLVRELGRKQTAEFIRNWLMASYDDAEGYRIDVIFADEARPETGLTQFPR